MRLKLFNLKFFKEKKGKKVVKENNYYGPITKYYYDNFGNISYSVEYEKGKIKNIKFL